LTEYSRKGKDKVESELPEMVVEYQSEKPRTATMPMRYKHDWMHAQSKWEESEEGRLKRSLVATPLLSRLNAKGLEPSQQKIPAFLTVRVAQPPSVLHLSIGSPAAKVHPFHSLVC
jgi:hypothetical protein